MGITGNRVPLSKELAPRLTIQLTGTRTRGLEDALHLRLAIRGARIQSAVGFKDGEECSISFQFLGPSTEWLRVHTHQ